MSFSVLDTTHMARALRVAERGLTTATPNPRVGCVLARDETVIAEGWHERAGGPHAEAMALAAANTAGKIVRGATAYVTLEPCAHQGRTAPCTEALINAGVARVVAAMSDPNPLVAGRGFIQLSVAKIAVAQGLLEEAANALNPGYILRMTQGRPLVRLKAAASLDGKTALLNGRSQWITATAARVDVHRFRARSCAVLTGVGTVKCDDPALTVRDVPCSRQPLRVIVDRQLTTPPTAKVLADGPALIYTAAEDKAGQALRALCSRRAISIVRLADRQGKVDLAAMFRDLAQRGINEVLTEAGARLNAALLQSGYVDELLLYQAPMLLGERAGGLALLPELTTLDGRIKMEIFETRKIGQDWRIRARLRNG